jgi:hypothetical protein
MKILMSITIAKQIEQHSGNSHDDACIVGTTIHLYHIESCIMGATENEPPFMLKYNLDETKLADYPVSSIQSGK